MTGSTDYPFHDGYLVSLSVDDGIAVLGLKQSDGTPYKMTLRGLEALSIDGFRQGNIILDLWSVSGRRPDAADVATDSVAGTMEILFPGPHPLAAGHYHEAHASFVEGKLDRIASGEATLVFIGPAYGAELYAFCASIELERLATAP